MRKTTWLSGCIVKEGLAQDSALYFLYLTDSLLTSFVLKFPAVFKETYLTLDLNLFSFRSLPTLLFLTLLL